MDSQRDNSTQTFRNFILFLSSDEEQGAVLYEDLRMRLGRYFRIRGLNEFEEAVDETLDRVMRRLDEGEQIIDYLKYSYGVARLVAIEWIKKQRYVSVDSETLVFNPTTDETDDEDSRLEALRDCLQRLDEAGRQLLLDYYDIGPRRLDLREKLARKHELTINSLRLRVFRMKKQLQSCVDKNFLRN